MRSPFRIPTLLLNIIKCFMIRDRSKNKNGKNGRTERIAKEMELIFNGKNLLANI